MPMRSISSRCPLVSRALILSLVLAGVQGFGLLCAEGMEVVPQGKVFTDWKLDLSSEQVLQNTPRTAFELTRVYLGAKGSFSERAAFKITYDVGHNGQNYQAFAKVAELDWKGFIPKSTLRFGLIGTFPFNLTEKAWGHRGIQKSGPDLWKVRPSADLGVSLVSQLSEELTLQGGLFNGEGYKKKEADGYPILQLRPIFQKTGVTLSPYLDLMPFDQGTTRKVQVMVGGFVGYARTPLVVGIDVLFQMRGDTKTLLTWGFARYAVNDGWEVIARGDHYDPDTSTSKDASQLLLLGISHQPSKHVECAVDFQLKHGDGQNEPRLFFHSAYSF